MQKLVSRLVVQEGQASVNNLIASLAYSAKEGHGDAVISVVEVGTMTLNEKELKFIIISFSVNE